MEKYQNKYRIPSARAIFWDYSLPGLYFITICTQNQIAWFGKVKDGEMLLSDIGEIVRSEWLKTFELRPDMNLLMGEFIVMPNHFHAIIGIGDNAYNRTCRDAMHAVSMDKNTACTDAMHGASTTQHNVFGSQSKNLASIVRGFKSAVSKRAIAIASDFQWQARYHDHIIRNEDSHQHIAQYIINNPAKWADDKFHQP
jgi:putative transposase